MKYKINYTETLHHVFYVNATTPGEARAKFNRQAETGDIDFSGGEVTDTDIEVSEVSEEDES